ncbi:hypothetical protein [Streptomyces sp. AP-93]|uniref:hypothetical protein n=1 Tax=Streptomyces sp. AP-93 TaxID=2929048 RepID=UPI001FB0358C|nr:hypothetical protein [Streptomyces sp. AP-93]MCJ0868100.1 hypothetical protein [Streptomyces sp. AP-93]
MNENDMPKIFVPTDSRHAPARLTMPADYDAETHNWVADALPNVFTWNAERGAAEFDRHAVNDVVAVLHADYVSVKVVHGVSEAHPERSSTLRR